MEGLSQRFHSAKDRIGRIAESIPHQTMASATLAAQDRKKTLARKDGPFVLTDRGYAQKLTDLIRWLHTQEYPNVLDAVSSLVTEWELHVCNAEALDGPEVREGTNAVVDGLLAIAAIFIEEAAVLLNVSRAENSFYNDYGYLAI